jgi:hypothetical protein
MFSNAPNQAACLPAGACVAGTVETLPATERAPAVCEPCEAGTYQPAEALQNFNALRARFGL